MAMVARRDTRPELELRRVLHSRGLRYRIDVPPDPSLRGRADILFRRARVAVYVDGCFWHSCPEHGILPKANRDWWRAKLEATVMRDRVTEEALRRDGWGVVRVWEHEDPESAADRIETVLSRHR
jgi:DNA mismatch endonuclease (patch repair protein)